MSDPQILRSALYSWRQVVPDCRLFPEIASTPTADFAETMALTDYVALLETIASDSGIPALGWKVGEAVSLTHFGDIWQIIDASQTLGAALKKMCDNFDLLQDLTDMQLTQEGDYATLTYRILDPAIWPRHQDAIYTLAIKARFLLATHDFPVHEAEIHLETCDQYLAAQLARASSMTCHTGADGNMIRFPAHYLSLPMTPTKNSDPEKIKALTNRLRAKKRPRRLDEGVRASIYSRMGRETVCQMRIARELGVSDRTLRRKLAERNTCFQEIVDDCRVSQAVLEITRCPSISISEIALRLGYSEHSTFSRAFSRCMGVSPQAFLHDVMQRRHGGLARM